MSAAACVYSAIHGYSTLLTVPELHCVAVSTGENTWRMIRVVNSSHDFTFHTWCTNDTEVFDLRNDAWQTTNLVDTNASSVFAIDVQRQFTQVLLSL